MSSNLTLSAILVCLDCAEQDACGSTILTLEISFMAGHAHHIQPHVALTDIAVIILVIIALVFLIWLYFIPTRIAFRRKHAMAGSIFLVNLLFGFTMIGWIVCLFWANSSDVKTLPPES